MENELLKQILEEVKRIGNTTTRNSENLVSIGELLKDAVTLHLDEEGKPDGVCVKSLDEMFIIDLYDQTTVLTYNEAVKKAKNNGKMLPSSKQLFLILAYYNEVLALLSSYGATFSKGYIYWGKGFGYTIGVEPKLTINESRGLCHNVRLIKPLSETVLSMNKKSDDDYTN